MRGYYNGYLYVFWAKKPYIDERCVQEKEKDKMSRKHKNAVKVNIPEYQTIREIIFEGTARGGDKKQFMYLDRNKQLQESNYNQTFKRIRTLSTYFYSKGRGQTPDDSVNQPVLYSDGLS